MHHLITITLPIRDNDGSDLSEEHRNLRSTLLNTVEGFSSYQISGQWIDNEGRIYEDESIRYEALVSAKDSKVAYWTIIKAAEHIAANTLQECILVTISEGHIVRYVDKDFKSLLDRSHNQ
jgi:hypothetical protein